MTIGQELRLDGVFARFVRCPTPAVSRSLTPSPLPVIFLPPHLRRPFSSLCMPYKMSLEVGNNIIVQDLFQECKDIGVPEVSGSLVCLCGWLAGWFGWVG